MKKLSFLIFSFLICCTYSNSTKIAVSIYPLKLILNEIGINSYVIIDKLVDVHSFEPSIRTILNAQNSCGFIYISDEFETWAKNINAKYKIKLLENEENPHIWTNPKFILNSISKIESILVKCKVHYLEDKIQLFKAKLKEIDSLNSVRSKELEVSFILLHTSFEPFLKAYNLKIESILIKEGHLDILPSDLNKALNSKYKIIIAESYYNKDLLSIFQKNNFKIIYLDPLGTKFQNYTDFIKYISDNIFLNKHALKMSLLNYQEQLHKIQ